MSNLITIQKTFYKVADFLSWKRKGGLILSPNFQRRDVWKSGAKSYLLDTVFRGLPIPIIFLRDRGFNQDTYEPIREVIDGQQRLRTLISFIAPTLIEDFKEERDTFLVKKSHNSEIAGKMFNELTSDIQERIINYEFNVHILPSNIDDRDVIQIFRRMNSTNYTLNSQELLNAEFYGEFKTCVHMLASEQLNNWRSWLLFTEDNISRMEEVELTAELCISMIEKSIISKSPGKIRSYFNDFDASFPQRKSIEDRFRTTMQNIYTNFTGNRHNFSFFKKTSFYPFFMSIYHLLYDINSDASIRAKHKALMQLDITKLTKKAQDISNKTAPANVISATDRRTTHYSERKRIFDYLIS